MLSKLVLMPATTDLKSVELGFFQMYLYCVWSDGLLGSKLHGGIVGGAPHMGLLSSGVCFKSQSVATKFLFAGYNVLLLRFEFWGLPLPICSAVIHE